MKYEAISKLELLNVREVAARLKLSSRQIFKLASAKRLPAPVKVGRSTRWRVADLEAWIASGCRMESAEVSA